MKIYFTLFAILFTEGVCFSQTQTLHAFNAKTILGANLDFSTLYGKKVMIVNTASYCGYTYQYEDLQSLYDMYKDSNFTIIGFPCNDFSNQEPGSDSLINEFCTDIYGITFQMMSKVAVVSQDTAPIFKWLQRADLNGVADVSVNWNFNKFLIDEAGHWVRHFTNLTEPFDTAIVNWILSPSVLPDTTDSTGTGLQHIQQPEIKVSHLAGNLLISFAHVVPCENARVNLFATSGALLAVIHDGFLQGNEVFTLDTRTVSPGIYVLQFASSRQSKTFKLVLAE